MKHLNEFLNEAKDVGHYERVGNQTIVDSNFVNYSKGILPDSELVHLGMGDFQLKTPKGNITFNRSGKLVGIGQDFVGRPHRATDDKGGKVLDELIKLMTKKKKAVLSMSGMDEINQFTGEAEKSEKYWDTKFKKAIKLFPTWADEKVDITNEIRQVYNERILDVIKGDKGYVEPIDRYEGDVEVYIEMATDLWNKMKGDVIAKEYALEDYVRWLK